MVNQIIKRGSFQAEVKSNCNITHVWFGPPNDNESDYILSIDIHLIPNLIAILKEIERRHKK